MQKLFSCLVPLFILQIFYSATAQKKEPMPPNKQAIINSVNRHEPELVRISNQIWEHAEIAMLEKQSSKLLADYAESNGFKVTRGVADIPTAFIAEYGEGRPIIGVLGEYDALPGLSQKALPVKDPLKDGAAGHGCGHNLFGAGSLGAAITIKELMAAGKLKGTIRFYGTPAEEAVGGKTYMARAGLFNDLDVCLDWHPDYENKADMQSSQAMVDYTVSFKGKSAHAAFDPWNGRSALDAAELFNIGVNFLREHVKPSVRIHYVYKSAGNVPNVIPDEASVWIWIRDSKRSGVRDVEQRVKQITEGAAMMAGVTVKMELTTGCYETLINETGAKALQANMELLGPITYTAEEMKFAKEIMSQYGADSGYIDGGIKALEKTNPDPEGGSSDVGDVSYIVPVIGFVATTAPYKAPWHSWVVTACGGMSIGHKGMLFAARNLGLTMVDLFENEKLRQEIRKEFEKRRGNEVWKAMLPEGAKPPVQ